MNERLSRINAIFGEYHHNPRTHELTYEYIVEALYGSLGGWDDPKERDAIVRFLADIALYVQEASKD